MILAGLIHRWRCKPKDPAPYSGTYDCPTCGQHWVSLVGMAGYNSWIRHPWRAR